MTDRTLVIDTATAACSVALFEGTTLIDARHEEVGRGHAERLLPMIAELPDGGRANRILVDVGPGSFTGIRVGIAAARGLALGWGVAVCGYSAPALVAAAALERAAAGEILAVVMEGGHGELFVQTFTAPLAAVDAVRSLPPAEALTFIGASAAIGSGTRRLAALDAAVPDRPALPRASDALLLPPDLRTLPPAPLYGRAPDAKVPGGATRA